MAKECSANLNETYGIIQAPLFHELNNNDPNIKVGVLNHFEKTGEINNGIPLIQSALVLLHLDLIDINFIETIYPISFQGKVYFYLLYAIKVFSIEKNKKINFQTKLFLCLLDEKLKKKEKLANLKKLLLENYYETNKRKKFTKKVKKAIKKGNLDIKRIYSFKILYLS
jgi:hypothetical protein